MIRLATGDWRLAEERASFHARGRPDPLREYPAAGEGAFTLVELMVALALAAVISVSIMFISSQARLAYDATVKKVDVYNRFRFALHVIEKDIKNWIPAADLETYTDGRGRGAVLNLHWDPGEEVPDRSDPAWGFGVVDGGVPGEYDEFAYILQRQYRSREKGQNEEKLHDAYQLYFRTITYVNGAVRVANVEYMLLDPNYAANNGTAPEGGDAKIKSKLYTPPRVVKEPDSVADLTLYKVVRYHDLSYAEIQRQNQLTLKREVLEVCPNVTDFKVEYVVEKDVRGKVEPGFRTPEADFKDPAELATRPRHDPRLGLNGGYRKVFGYGSIKLEEKFERGTAYAGRRGDNRLSRGGGAEHEPVRFGFRGNPKISFSELVPGDKIFIFTQSSRGEQIGAPGVGVADNKARLTRFPSKDYTIKANFEGLLEFEEDIDTTEWGGQPQNDINYKAAFVPAAVRITLRIVDDRGENPKTLQREIWLRRRSR